LALGRKLVARRRYVLHVTEDHLRQLAENRLETRVRTEVVRHLLAACRPCLDLARKVLFPESDQELDYTGVLRRLELAGLLALNSVEVERGSARALWDSHLAHLAPGLRLMAIRHNPDLHTWGMFDLLLMEAKRVALEQPLESLDLAYAALEVTGLLSPEAYSAERIHDLRASAWACLGNTKRRAGDFAGAEEALRAAAESLEQGSGDPYEEANVLSMTASLLTDLGDLEEATDLLEDAVKLAYVCWIPR
jgi:tetratricopeptide (TPR) repeat protein